MQTSLKRRILCCNMTKIHGRPPFTQTILISICGVLLGGFAGVVTLLFVRAMEAIQHFIWTYIPSQLDIPIPSHLYSPIIQSSYQLYTIIVCIIGGILVGLGAKYLGNYPGKIQEELARFKHTGEFDYKHIPQAIGNSLISLGFGASLGPEAALTTIVGGFSTWVSKKLRFLSLDKTTLQALGISSSFGALFGSPIGSAGLATTSSSANGTKLQLRLAGFLAALGGLVVFKFGTRGGESYFNLQTIPYIFKATDLLWAVSIALIGFIAGIGFLFIGQKLIPLTKSFKGFIPQAMLGGLILGVGGAISSLILFSGHEGVQTIMNTYASSTGIDLILIALGKAVIACILLVTGWKGGQFFPVMFAGAAIGLGFANILGFAPMIGLVAGMTGMLATAIKQPILGGIFVIAFFPPNLYPAIGVAALIIFALVRLCRKMKLLPILVS